MKSPTCSVTLSASLLLAAVLLGGCAGPQVVHPARTSTTMQGITEDYRQARLQAAATEDALKELEIAPLPDLKQAFDTFTINLRLMEELGGRLLAHADGMLYRGTYYFVESGRSTDACVFPRQTTPDDRLTLDLGREFGAIAEMGEEVKRAYRAFQFDIEQIYNVISNNLTPTGVETVDQILRKAAVDSDSLQEKLQEGLAVLEHAATVLQQKEKKG